MLRVKKIKSSANFSKDILIIEQLRIYICSVVSSRKFEVEKIQSKMGEG